MSKKQINRMLSRLKNAVSEIERAEAKVRIAKKKCICP